MLGNPRLILLFGWLRWFLLPGVLYGQVETPPPVVGDTGDVTGRFIEARELAKAFTGALPKPGTDDLLPPNTRMVFIRDSIEWSNVGSVAELIHKVPGVYLLRGGWIGQAELPVYQGRGPSAVEYFLDGVPHFAIGTDSLAIDPSTLPLSFFDRIEVEELPGVLRVHLYTKRHDRAAPRTRIAITAGDLDVARYQGSFEKRFPSGLGLSAAFEFQSISAQFFPNENDYQNAQGWGQISWLRGPRSGAVLQYFTTGPERLPNFGFDLTSGDTLGRGLDESRGDLQARVYLRSRADGMGGALDFVATRTTWSAFDSLDRAISQLGVIAAHRSPLSSFSVAAFKRSDWTNLDITGRAGFTPSPRVTVSGEVVYRRHDGDRETRLVTGRAGFFLLPDLSITGTWRRGDAVDFPALVEVGERSVNDRSLTAAWQRPSWQVEVSYSSLSSQPSQPYRTFAAIADIGSEDRSEWLSAHARVSPKNWISLDLRYSDPVGSGTTLGQPPEHLVLTGAIFSRFIRVFPSGIFGLKLEGSVERFGSGVIGRNTAGDPVSLASGTLVRGLIQFQFGSFIAYFDRQNLLSSDVAFVPGLRLPIAANSFGIRWEFWN